MKIVLNKCYGGFGLSTEAGDYLIEKKGWKIGELIELRDDSEQEIWGKYWFPKDDTIDFRTNPDVVEAVEVLGSEKASGAFSKLGVIEIPDDIGFSIEEYDGIEWIAEKHRTWG